MSHDKYPPPQWTPQYISSTNAYSSSVYQANPVSSSSFYDNVDSRPVHPPSYPSGYHGNPTNYSPTSPTGSQHVYSPVPPTLPLNYAQVQAQRSPHHHVPRPQSTAPYLQGHSYSHSYSQSPTTVHSPVPHVGRSRSHSQAYDRVPSAPVEMMPPPPPPPSQHPEIPIPQMIGLSSDHPSSPTRPFPCDLCALSFNRQHDLKRHRDTHTGDKPFLCNGGCGKTFTRKDALKRHQLVKRCGKVEDSWS